MGKAARSVNASPTPRPFSPLGVMPVLDVPLLFFNAAREGTCRLRLFAPIPEREQASWRAWLSQESEATGWSLTNGLECAVRAAWELLGRLKHGDWPLLDDPRLAGLPPHPSEVEWIEHWDDQSADEGQRRRLHALGLRGENGQSFRRVRFSWDGHTPFAPQWEERTPLP